MSQDDAAKVAALRKLKGNFPLYAKHVLRIINKQGAVVPFELNRGQLLMHQMLERQWKSEGRIRALAIKARQVGISTYTEGRYYSKVTGTPNANAYVLSHLSKATDNLFRMVRNFHKYAPDPIFAPALSRDANNTLEFADINSSYDIGTARSKEVGRSGTYRYVHGSEVAFYPDQEEIVKGLLQTAPVVGSEVILESTANGVGDWFHEQVMRALNDKRSDYIVVFIPWFWMPEYRLNPGPYFSRTKSEESLAKLYNLDDAQLEFRRSKIRESGEDGFKQEYPSTAEEAFLFSGRSFFEQGDLDANDLECFTPGKVGVIERIGGAFRSEPGGPYQEWVAPRPEGSYVIGVDVAEGLQHGDYTVAQVLDERGNQVAKWRGHHDPYEFAEILRFLALRFSHAFLIVERNNHGLTVIRRLQDLNYPDQYLFVDHTLDRAYADRSVKRAGFLTTSKTKPLVLDNLKALIRQGESGIRDPQTISECRVLVVDERGRINAQPGAHDDCVMAYALAVHGLSFMPRKRVRVASKPAPAPTTAGY